jgi:hypothetical protein
MTQPQPEDAPPRVPYKNLRRLALEGFTIVAGILVAFGIDAWWGERKAAESERALLGDVIQELAQIQAVLENAGQYHARHRIAGQRIMEDAADLNEEIMATAISHLLSFVTLDISTGALDAALSGEGLGRIASNTTRVLLARWPGAYADLKENEDLELELIEYWLHPLLRSRVSLPDIVGTGGTFGLSQDPATAARRPPRDPSRFSKDLQALRSDREFKGLVFQILANDAGLDEEYSDLQTLVSRIMQTAQASLAR